MPADADAGDDPKDPIPVAIETPRGLLVAVLRASGRPIYPINPMSVARYRERTSMSGKKFDYADAVTLANILRTDADQHRRLPADAELAQSITVPPGRIRTPPGGAPAPATHCGRCCGSITRVSCIPSPTAPAESPHPKPARCWPSPPPRPRRRGSPSRRSSPPCAALDANAA